MNRDFICDRCPYTTKRQFNLKKHLRTHTGEKAFFCKKCEKKFADSSNLSKHFIRCSGKLFNCNHCDRQFTSASLLSRHKQNLKMEAPFVCPQCKQGFKREINLTKHIANVHPTQHGIMKNLAIYKKPALSATSTASMSLADIPLVEEGSGSEDDNDIESYPPTQAFPKQKDKLKPEPLTIYGPRRKRPLTVEEEMGGENVDYAADFFKRGKSDNSTSPLTQTVDTQNEGGEIGNGSSLDCTNNDLEETDIEDRGIIPATQAVNLVTTDDEDESQSDVSRPEVNEFGKVHESQDPPISSSVDLPPAPVPGAAAKSDNHLQPDSSQYSSPNHPTSLNLDLKFMLALWKVTSQFSSLDSELNGKEKLALDLLVSGGQPFSSEAMIAALQQKLDMVIGLFPVSMITMEYLQRLSLIDLLQFCKSMADSLSLSPLLKKLIESVTRHKLQIQLSDFIEDDSFLVELPENLRSSLQYKYLVEPQSRDAKRWTDLGIMESANKDACLIMTEMINVTLFEAKAGRIKFMDESYSEENRCSFWMLLIQTVTNGSYDLTASLQENVLLAAQKVRNQTVPYMLVDTAHHQITLNLHEQVLLPLTSGFANQQKVVATTNDIHLFLQKLYCKNKTIELNQVTLGLYDLTWGCGIANVWIFLMGLTPNFDALEGSEPIISITKIAIFLKRELELKLFWRKVSYGDKCLIVNGLSINHIQFIFEMSNLGISEIEKYGLLLTWCFNETGLPCQNFRLAKYNPVVAQTFATVKHFLKMSSLQPYFYEIAAQCYISFKDIRSASLISTP